MRTLGYTLNVERTLGNMSSVALEQEFKDSVAVSRKRGRLRKNGDSQLINEETHNVGEKESKKMSETKKVQRTVFDLGEFKNILLVKEIVMPDKPSDLKAALEIVNHDESKLVELIHQGLMAEARDLAYADMSGYKVFDDETDEAGEDYTGKCADEDKGKLIRGAILAFAKMQGYNQSMSKDQKKALKEKAAEFIRSNPAMLTSIQG